MPKTTQSVNEGSGSAPRKLLWGPQKTGAANYVFLALAIVAQIVTIYITWNLWQIRTLETTFPNLPWFSTLPPPQLSYAWLLIASLVFLLTLPGRLAWGIHLAILAAAIFSDQFRCQPQILAPLFLIAACLFPSMKRGAVWFLIAMWLWAGLHKLISPDWFGEVTYSMLLREEFRWGELAIWEYHRWIAFATAVVEIGLAIVAWRRPKLAAPICFVMHLGIAVFLIAIRWNYSVLPWNFCTAGVGTWLLWTVSPPKSPVNPPSTAWGRAGLTLLMLMPVAFYFGLLRHSLCHVLYSANFPDAVISGESRFQVCSAIEELRVPFPHHRKSFVDFFRLTASPGDKLHIKEYRRGLSDGYFVINDQKRVKEISEIEFYKAADGWIRPIAFDDRRALFQLNKYFHRTNKSLAENDSTMGRILKRDSESMVWAIQFNPATFDPALFDLLSGLPNLEQIQLSRCDVTDDDLKRISMLSRLKGIGLNETHVTDAGLEHLRHLPDIELIEHDKTSITEAAVRELVSPQTPNSPRN